MACPPFGCQVKGRSESHLRAAQHQHRDALRMEAEVTGGVSTSIHPRTNTYDDLNRLETTTDTKGITVTNEYDAAGNKTAVINDKSQRTEFTYDKHQLTMHGFGQVNTVDIQKIVAVNAPSVLFSSTREVLVQMTARSPRGVIDLPTLSFANYDLSDSMPTPSSSSVE